jgi:hypothetical protein
MVIKHIKKLLGIKPAEVTPEAPYKIEAPVEPAPAPKKKPTVKKATTKVAKEEAPVAKVKKPRAPRKPKTTNE